MLCHMIYYIIFHSMAHITYFISFETYFISSYIISYLMSSHISYPIFDDDHPPHQQSISAHYIAGIDASVGWSSAPWQLPMPLVKSKWLLYPSVLLDFLVEVWSWIKLVKLHEAWWSWWNIHFQMFTWSFYLRQRLWLGCRADFWSDESA